MGADAKRWVWWACMLVPGCTGSDDGDDRPPPDPNDMDPPTLQAAAFVDGTTLRLTFSEPMTAPSPFDPAAYRLSLGFSYDLDGTTFYYAVAYDHELGYATSDADDPTGNDMTSGYDPTGYDPTGYDPTGYYDPTAGYDDGYDGGYASPASTPNLALPIPPMRVQDVAITSAETVSGNFAQLDLTLASDITQTDTCTMLVELDADGIEAAIFLHYRRPEDGGLQDVSGNQLASIAEHWVMRSEDAYVTVTGRFPSLTPYVPIACP